MKCANCGFTPNPGDQICMNCGAKLSLYTPEEIKPEVVETKKKDQKFLIFLIGGIILGIIIVALVTFFIVKVLK